MSATNLKPVPLSVQAGNQHNQSAKVTIGSVKLEQDAATHSPCLWFLVLDRRTLKVVVNHRQKTSEHSTVPADVLKYAKDWAYILVFVTLNLAAWDLPQGALYTFLRKNGGGRELRAMERLFEAFGSGWYPSFGYSLVDVLGIDGPGHESMKYGPGRGVLLLTLEPVPAPGGGEWYVPVQLAD